MIDGLVNTEFEGSLTALMAGHAEKGGTWFTPDLYVLIVLPHAAPSHTHTYTHSSPNATLIRSRRQFFHQGFLVPNYFLFDLIFLKKLGTKMPLVKKLLLDLIRVALGDEHTPGLW